jgi:pyruvate ferredoxin oxidoreductase gamma subunit
MSASLAALDLRRMLSDSALEIRGEGKAGGGLVLAFQSLGNLFLRDAGMNVQEWPFFGSARRGANIRSFLRVSLNPVTSACEVTRPQLVLLMDEGAAASVDFAQGVPPGGTFVLNTRRSPEECARHYRLSGRVLAVAGDDIGTRYLKHPIGNVSAYVAMAQAIGGFERDDVIEAFLRMLRKRHVPEAVLARNREALSASFGSIREGVFDFTGASRSRATASCRPAPRRRSGSRRPITPPISRRAAFACASRIPRTLAPAARTASPTVPRASSGSNRIPSWASRCRART